MVLDRRTSTAFVATVATVLSLAGCASSRSFLSTDVPRVRYADVEKRVPPLSLKVAVEFQRDGISFPKGDIPLRDYAIQILRASGVVAPIGVIPAAGDREEGVIRLVLNNVTDGDAVVSAAGGARAGLPPWLAGKTITDAYVMSIAITRQGRTVRRTGLRHAFHTTVGNVGISQDVEAFPSDEAFGRMLEQLILRGLQEMQEGGELSRRGGERRPEAVVLLPVGPAHP